MNILKTALLAIFLTSLISGCTALDKNLKKSQAGMEILKLKNKAVHTVKGTGVKTPKKNGGKKGSFSPEILKNACKMGALNIPLYLAAKAAGYCK